jgi:hypothetical protein
MEVEAEVVALLAEVHQHLPFVMEALMTMTRKTSLILQMAPHLPQSIQIILI